jgi:plastocyanin
MSRSILRRALPAFGLALLLVAVAPLSAVAAGNEVVIQNFAFVPQSLTVTAGSQVTWISRDNGSHFVVSQNSAMPFKSKTLNTNDTFSVTFTTPGTYNYRCGIHSYMTGTIVVR